MQRTQQFSGFVCYRNNNNNKIIIIIIIIIIITIIIINIYTAQIPCEYDQMRATNKHDTN